MPSDPFDEVKADVAAAVSEAEATLTQWRARHEEPTAKRLLAELASVEIDLADMDSAIESAAQNPERFKISASTLAERRAFVRTTRSTVAAAREEVSKTKASGGKATAKRASAEERVGLLAGGGGGGASSGGGKSGASRRQRDLEEGNTQLLGSQGSLQQVTGYPASGATPMCFGCDWRRHASAHRPCRRSSWRSRSRRSATLGRRWGG